MECNAILTKKMLLRIFQQMIDNIFGKYSFVLVYIDDILVFFIYSLGTHKAFGTYFLKLVSHELIASKKKMK